MASIYSIVGDFAGNFVESTYGSAKGGAIFNEVNFADVNIEANNITEARIDYIEGSFVNNTATTQEGNAYGGAIYNGVIDNTPRDPNYWYGTDSMASIGLSSSEFIGNGAISIKGEARGGAIYNLGTFQSYAYNFQNNYAQGNTSAKGGAIYSKGEIILSISDFVNNYVKATGTNSVAKGGAIYMGFSEGYNDYQIHSAKGNYAKGTSAYGGFTAIDGNTPDFGASTNFGLSAYLLNDNYVSSTSGNAFGGALFVANANSEVMSTLILDGNYATSESGIAKGGAIYMENIGHNTSGTVISITNNYASSKTGEAYGGAYYFKNAGMSFMPGDWETGIITILGNWAGTDINNRSDANGGFAYLEAPDIKEEYGATSLSFDGDVIIGDGRQGYDSIASNNENAQLSFYSSYAQVNSSLEYFLGTVFIRNSTLDLNNKLGGRIETTNSFVEDLNTNFIARKSLAKGGAIDNYKEEERARYGSVEEGGSIMMNIIGNFENNSVINSDFVTSVYGSDVKYFAQESAKGGAISNYSFVKMSEYEAAPRYDYNDSVFASMENIEGNFTSNSANGNVNAFGGAISNYSEVYAKFKDKIANSTIKNITGDFTNNTASVLAVANEELNHSLYTVSGGAISNYAKSDNVKTGDYYEITSKPETLSSIANIKGDFVGNTANVDSSAVVIADAIAKGGAIANEAYAIKNVEKANDDDYSRLKATASIGDITGDFINNSAVAKSANKATAQGGAIYNSYAENFINTFDKTKCTSQMTATIGNIEGDFTGNYALATGTDAIAQGGAIYNYACKVGNNEAENSIANLSILALSNDSKFTGNYVQANDVKTSNAIHNEAFEEKSRAYIDINAFNTSKVVMNDAIGGGAENVASQVININNKNLSTFVGAKNYSVVEINNVIKNQTVNVYNGILKFGEYKGTSDLYGDGSNVEVASSVGSLDNSTLYIADNATLMTKADYLGYEQLDALKNPTYKIINDGTVDLMGGTLYHGGTRANNGSLSKSIKGSGTVNIFDTVVADSGTYVTDENSTLNIHGFLDSDLYISENTTTNVFLTEKNTSKDDILTIISGKITDNHSSIWVDIDVGATLGTKTDIYKLSGTDLTELVSIDFDKTLEGVTLENNNRIYVPDTVNIKTEDGVEASVSKNVENKTVLDVEKGDLIIKETGKQTIDKVVTKNDSSVDVKGILKAGELTDNSKVVIDEKAIAEIEIISESAKVELKGGLLITSSDIKLLSDTDTSAGVKAKSGLIKSNNKVSKVSLSAGQITVDSGKALEFDALVDLASNIESTLGSSDSIVKMQKDISIGSDSKLILVGNVGGSANIIGSGKEISTVKYTGVYAPGNSPELVTHSNTTVDLTDATLEMEIFGSKGVAGEDFDKIIFENADVSFGDIKIILEDIDTWGKWTGFEGEVMDFTFDIFDFDSNTNIVDSRIFTLEDLDYDEGKWNVAITNDELFTSGAISLSVTSIPEPSTYAMIFGALALGLACYRKRK